MNPIDSSKEYLLKNSSYQQLNIVKQKRSTTVIKEDVRAAVVL